MKTSDPDEANAEGGEKAVKRGRWQRTRGLGFRV